MKVKPDLLKNVGLATVLSEHQLACPDGMCKSKYLCRGQSVAGPGQSAHPGLEMKSNMGLGHMTLNLGSGRLHQRH